MNGTISSITSQYVLGQGYLQYSQETNQNPIQLKSDACKSDKPQYVVKYIESWSITDYRLQTLYCKMLCELYGNKASATTVHVPSPRDTWLELIPVGINKLG